MTPADLNLLKSWARAHFLSFKEGERMEGHVAALSHGDKLALAYFEATVRYIKSKKIDIDTFEVALENPDSDPETEDADWFWESPPEED